MLISTTVPLDVTTVPPDSCTLATAALGKSCRDKAVTLIEDTSMVSSNSSRMMPMFKSSNLNAVSVVGVLSVMNERALCGSLSSIICTGLADMSFTSRLENEM